MAKQKSAGPAKREGNLDELSAPEKAIKTARWAVTLAKQGISFSSGKRLVGGKKVSAARRWNLVTFLGRGGGESGGIVDVLAIRKDHSRAPDAALKRGDLFEIVLLQIKGGSAERPTDDEKNRLRRVARFYRAKAVVWAEWKRGRKPVFLRLAGNRWAELENLRDVFG